MANTAVNLSVRPDVAIVKGEIHRAVDRALRVLSDPALGIYARGEDLVRAVVHDRPSTTLSVRKQADNVRRSDGSVILAVLGADALTEELTRSVQFKKYSARAQDYVPCDCPPELARMILARKGHGWAVPPLRAVITAPTLRPDGTVINQSGYDAATGLLLVSDHLWRTIPEQPTKQDAIKAAKVLMQPIRSLPFRDESDRAGAIALLITSVLRPCLVASPMFAVGAPSAGTGKSLTIDIASIMATGRRPAVVTPTSDQEELEKRIGASAIAGDQVISIDNVTHVLKSDKLCQMLTQPEVKVRILGQSRDIRVPSTALICATGNNLSVHGDLNRRTVMIRLDAKCERPEERMFDFDAIELAHRMRPDLVAAALTIVRAYLSAGSPAQAVPMGSFEDWSDIVRSALMWIGLPDCRGDVVAIYAEDEEKAKLADVMNALPYGPFTAKDVAQAAHGDPAAREALEDFINRSGSFSTRALGKYLSRYKDTRVGGRFIQLVRQEPQGSVWKVQSE